MNETIQIPQDMVNEELSKQMGGTVVSVRDFLVALGLSDEELREHDRIQALRKEILEREPWRDQTKIVPISELKNGFQLCCIEGEIDWSGTPMEEIEAKRLERERSQPRHIGREQDGQRMWFEERWNGSEWAVTSHYQKLCECEDCKKARDTTRLDD